MITGTAYGIALNDSAEIARRAASFAEKPYAKAPEAPVLYIKPRNTFASDGATIMVPQGIAEVEIGATLALRFGSRPNVPVLAALAADICEPHDSVYRPAIRERCGDGFLPLADFSDWNADLAGIEITTAINGEVRHVWSLGRLVRPPVALAGELGAFMTLTDGDVLLCGLADDAARAKAGDTVNITAPGLASLTFQLIAEISA